MHTVTHTHTSAVFYHILMKVWLLVQSDSTLSNTVTKKTIVLWCWAITLSWCYIHTETLDNSLLPVYHHIIHQRLLYFYSWFKIMASDIKLKSERNVFNYCPTSVVCVLLSLFWCLFVSTFLKFPGSHSSTILSWFDLCPLTSTLLVLAYC